MRPRKKTNEEIIEIARQVFITSGPQSAVEEISKIVGLSQPALFKRFGTKRNLLIQTLKPPKNVIWHKTIKKDLDDRPFKEQLVELTLEIQEWFVKLAPLLIAIKFSGISPDEFMKDEKEPIPVKSVRLLSEWLDKCCRKGLIRKTNFRIAATSILGFIHSDTVISTMNPEKEGDTFGDIKECVDFIWNGLKP